MTPPGPYRPPRTICKSAAVFAAEREVEEEAGASEGPPGAGVGSALEGEGEGEETFWGSWAGDAVVGRSAMQSSHLVRAGELRTVHWGQLHSRWDASRRDVETRGGVGSFLGPAGVDVGTDDTDEDDEDEDKEEEEGEEEDEEEDEEEEQYVAKARGTSLGHLLSNSLLATARCSPPPSLYTLMCGWVAGKAMGFNFRISRSRKASSFRVGSVRSLNHASIPSPASPSSSSAPAMPAEEERWEARGARLDGLAVEI